MMSILIPTTPNNTTEDETKTIVSYIFIVSAVVIVLLPIKELALLYYSLCCMEKYPPKIIFWEKMNQPS